jgi:2-keto-3-deoxy-L-rhamnonate aldolase RhmA
MRVAVVLLLSSLAALAQTEPTNPLKRTLAEGKPVVGLTVTLASADVAVQAASLGFDFIWIEMEHSPITLETAHNLILATRGTSLVPLVRVPVNELWTAKRALDVGALGVIFPFTSTPELARQAVAACKYPPLGKRGYGPGLASMRWPAPEGYAAFANANSFVVVIIETAEAIRNIEEIAATPGIDVLFIGVNDLSYSLGRGGKLDDPDVKAAVAKVLAAGRKNNVPVGRPATAAQVQELMKEGFRFFQAPSDLALLGVGAKPLLDAAGKKAPDLKSRPLY